MSPSHILYQLFECHDGLTCITVDPETKKEFEEMQSKGPMTGSQGAAGQSMCTALCSSKRLMLTLSF